MIYFHGLPGSAGELALFGKAIELRTRAFHVVARTGPGSGDMASDYFTGLAADIRRRFSREPLHLIGFSLGAAAALRTAAHLGDQVRQIDLVSAAGPLELGDYLDGMAGAPIFRMASANPWAFRLLTRLQGLMARQVPGRLFAMLFATAQGADQVLRDSPEFRAGMQQVLREALSQGRQGYCQEIAHYVRTWSGEISRVDAPVAIFHGADDNWSPVAMAEDVAHELGHCETLTVWPGLSHYSALQAYLAQR